MQGDRSRTGGIDREAADLAEDDARHVQTQFRLWCACHELAWPRPARRSFECWLKNWMRRSKQWLDIFR